MLNVMRRNVMFATSRFALTKWRLILMLFNYYLLVKCCISEWPTNHFVSSSG
jgi:hypothetical protein